MWAFLSLPLVRLSVKTLQCILGLKNVVWNLLSTSILMLPATEKCIDPNHHCCHSRIVCIIIGHTQRYTMHLQVHILVCNLTITYLCPRRMHTRAQTHILTFIAWTCWTCCLPQLTRGASESHFSLVSHLNDFNIRSSYHLLIYSLAGEVNDEA